MSIDKGTLTLETVAEEVTFSLYWPLLRVAELSSGFESTVARSVAASLRNGRNAWRDVVRKLPEDHLIRRAVLDGLSR